MVDVGLLQELVDVFRDVAHVYATESSTETEEFKLSADIELLKRDYEEGHYAADDNTVTNHEIQILKHQLHFIHPKLIDL